MFSEILTCNQQIQKYKFQIPEDFSNTTRDYSCSTYFWILLIFEKKRKMFAAKKLKPIHINRPASIFNFTNLKNFASSAIIKVFAYLFFHFICSTSRSSIRIIIGRSI